MLRAKGPLTQLLCPRRVREADKGTRSTRAGLCPVQARRRIRCRWSRALVGNGRRRRTGRQPAVGLTSRRTRAVSLFLAGVLVFCDAGAVAAAAFIATIAMLFAVGFVERRVGAVAWAAILVASAFFADFLWQLGWEPFNRSDDYEAIPQTPFVLIGLPIPMAVVAIGVGVGALWRRVRSQPNVP